MAKIYVLKTWKTSPGNPEGWWDNYKATFDEREAELWIEPPSRTMNEEGPDPDHTYDEFEVNIPEYSCDVFVEGLANDYAKEIGATEPDWFRKQVVKFFTKGFVTAKTLKEKDE